MSIVHMCFSDKGNKLLWPHAGENTHTRTSLYSPQSVRSYLPLLWTLQTSEQLTADIATSPSMV